MSPDVGAEPIPDYTLTEHALFEMGRRQIDEATVREVLARPEQRLSSGPARVVLQSRILFGPTRQVLEAPGVKVTYDPHTDTLSIVLRDDALVAESDEGKPGIILDYDDSGNLVSLEVLDASRRVSDARKIEFQTTS